jgi:GDPmannose 4,6-dehydratase
MLQHDEPDDYVIATGEQHSVREFVKRAFAEVGIGIAFKGEGAEEVGVVDSVAPDLLAQAREGSAGAFDTPMQPGTVLVRVDTRYFRPTEVSSLVGDASKARERLGWRPTITFDQLVHEMVHDDLAVAQRDELCRAQGFRVSQPRE